MRKTTHKVRGEIDRRSCWGKSDESIATKHAAFWECGTERSIRNRTCGKWRSISTWTTRVYNGVKRGREMGEDDEERRLKRRDETDKA